jgi:hypothetical protein
MTTLRAKVEAIAAELDADKGPWNGPSVAAALRALLASPEATTGRLREIEDALRQIRDYEPEREAFRLDNESCPDCKRNRERQWPPSGLCEKHYCRMDDIRHANSDVDARQHYHMRELARAALVSPSPLPRGEAADHDTTKESAHG